MFKLENHLIDYGMQTKQKEKEKALYLCMYAIRKSCHVLRSFHLVNASKASFETFCGDRKFF